MVAPLWVDFAMPNDFAKYKCWSMHGDYSDEQVRWCAALYAEARRLQKLVTDLTAKEILAVAKRLGYTKRGGRS